MRAWVKHSKLENFNSLLIFNVDDITPSGTLCHFREKADFEVVTMMLTTPLKELYNVRRYIHYLILECEYDYDDDDFDNPQDEDNWLFQPEENS